MSDHNVPRTTLTFTFTLTFLVLSVLLASAGSVGAAPVLPALSDHAVVRPKANPVIAAHAKTFLLHRDGPDTALVWVFFTDKGLPARTSLNGSAAAVTFPERTMKRRAKMHLDKVVFADLPVKQEYIDEVSALGASVHRVSRWLNAASYYMPVSMLDEVATLPFVASIRPVAKFHVEEVTVTPPRNDNPPTALDAQALNYGNSLGQLTQINVPAAHQAGYSG
ncbi:MAG: hypothetical protein D6800_08405, partial [Candidatus Zixiibacteriota bacterium]